MPAHFPIPKPSANRNCSACDRPFAAQAGCCPYCGESARIPQRTRILRILLLALAGCSAIGWTFPRLLADPCLCNPFVTTLAPKSAAVLGLALGIFLLPSLPRSLPGFTRSERIRQAASRLPGRVLLTTLTAATTLSACVPIPWSASDAAWWISAVLSTILFPVCFDAPARLLVAGILLALGMR
jgi:hypothetical protein